MFNLFLIITRANNWGSSLVEAAVDVWSRSLDFPSRSCSDLNVFVIALNLIAKDVPNGPKCYPQLLRDIILAIVIYSSFCL